MGEIFVDEKKEERSFPAGTTVATAFGAIRDEILKTGRIISDVRVGDDPVTWDDGSSDWQELLADSGPLILKTDYPVRISGPLLERVIETLPATSRQHQELADSFRKNDRQRL